jgi:restriction endonuclease Mrr
MLPLLKLVADGQEHKYRDLIESLAVEFQETDEERKELLASGNCSSSTRFKQQACRTFDNPGSPNRVSNKTLQNNGFK